MSDSDPPSDPALLFMLKKSVSPAEKSSVAGKATNSGPSQRAFFIAPPVLPLAQKKQYKPMSDLALKSEVETPVNEVIGEHREGRILYYFARYDGGIANKYPAQSFVKKHAGLVEAYKRKRDQSQLKPFDPSAAYVHPLSRVKTRANTSSDRAKVDISSTHSINSDQGEVVPDSEDESQDDRTATKDEEEKFEEDNDEGDDDDEEDDNQDGYSEDASSVQRRRSRRTRTIKSQVLPFSPKKTRSQKVIAIHDSDSETGYDSTPNSPVGTRRSTRNKTVTKVKLDTDYSDDSAEEDEGDSDSFEGSRRRKSAVGVTKKKKIPKASIPSYGHIRDVSELDGDPYPDDAENIPLREHREICEKCHEAAAHKLVAAFVEKKSRGRPKKRKRSTDDEFEESDSEEALKKKGGWVRCLKCPVAAHWRCLAATQRDEIMKAARAKDREEWDANHQDDEASASEGPPRRTELDAQQITDFICGACIKGGICMGCMDIALEPGPSHAIGKFSTRTSSEDVEMITNAPPFPGHEDEDARQLLFRCFTCKRPAHYAHLPIPSSLTEDATLGEIARYYQHDKSWLCADCSSYRYALDKIIAWRPYPPNAIEAPRLSNEPPHYKDTLPREYLVKWVDRSYKRTQWVPHMWLVSTSAQKLKHFLAGGPKLQLLEEPVEEDKALENEKEASDTFELGAASRSTSAKPGDGLSLPKLPTSAMPDAERRIPPAWKTVDRVLDVVLWYPKDKRSGKKDKQKKRIVASDSESFDEKLEEERTIVREYGEPPSPALAGTLAEWEDKVRRKLTVDDIDRVAWAFIKWDDLGYDEATWDAPPLQDEFGYDAFETAFTRLVESQEVYVPKLSQAHANKFDNRIQDGYRKHVLEDAADLRLGQDPKLKLMPFQVDGFNWLCNNWWNHQHCILADEMGLGKTVQIATFLGNIADKWKAFPVLVVVPNSTITNWVREFERWAPKLRVVPYYGEKRARDIIQKYELFHRKSRPGDTTAKFHVLVTTYEMLTKGTEFSIFKNQPRWEVLVVDEGQRLKSDSSLLFKKLNELKSIHRIIMTGTPLNNNIRELFNLMNFLDPEEWKDLEALEKEHQELNEELVKQLHSRLRPYFLRRIKSEVLQLPPKNEVIVPVSMAPLQKEVYRSILSHNADLLKGLVKTSKITGSATKGRINNVLMQLRKCLQHPYLFAEDIEPTGLSDHDSHEKLIDASAKLRFLKALLPKLKERGHRVLLFSQFVIALNVIEDFLQGEGHKFLRLDGNTKGSVRQKGMDEFNRPGSDVFIYLLTTRAGGVGINLFSADTVIIFDPDFNPHQDLQAIARAYRFGQQKTCLVFKLMVKDSAEERIMQIGKKKLVLDHLIVQKMDDDEETGGENVQSILTYGAQTLFEGDQTSKDITYSDQDIDKLIEKTEKEGDQEEAPKGGGLSFSFAKIWAADKDSLEEVGDDDQADSWAQALQLITAEREKQLSQEVALSGRGARRKAADIAKTRLNIESIPAKGKRKSKSKSTGSDGSAYHGSEIENDSDSDSDSTDAHGSDNDFKMGLNRKSRSKLTLSSLGLNGPLGAIQNIPQSEIADCGLCGGRHGSGLGECLMTDRSENLAEFREMLILHADDEPWEDRYAAVRAIDEILFHRNHYYLIAGQPLHPLPTSLPSTNAPPKKAKTVDSLNIASSSTLPQTGSSIPITDPSQPAYSSKQPVAGSSKRPSSPVAGESSKKKLKLAASLTSCPVCGGTPHQSMAKECPIVLEGPPSVSAAIARLNQDPANGTTVQILWKILAKQKRREMEVETAELSGWTIIDKHNN